MTWCSKGLQHPLPPPYLCTTLYSLLLSFALVLMEKLQEVDLLPLHGTLVVQKVQYCAVFSYRLQDTACQSVQTSALSFMFWEMSHDAAFLVCSILCFSGVILLVVFPTAYWDVLMGKNRNSRMRQSETKEWFPSHNPAVVMRWVWSCYLEALCPSWFWCEWCLESHAQPGWYCSFVGMRILWGCGCSRRRKST